MPRVVFILLVLALAASKNALAADQFSARQAAIFTRVLSYDRNLAARAGKAVTVAVLSSRNLEDREIGHKTMGVFRTLEKLTIAGRPLEVVHVEVDSAEEIADALERYHPDAVYLSSGLETLLGEITRVCRALDILSMSSRSDDVVRGASVGVVVEMGALKIHINLGASRDEGASFASDLLALAKIVR